MRYPICHRFCGTGLSYSHDIIYDPYDICGCNFSQSFLSHNTSVSKEMSNSPAIIKVPYISSTTTPGAPSPNISNSMMVNPTRIPVVAPTSEIPSSMKINTSQTTDPISSKLTVYSRSGHIIQKYNKETKIITLPKSVEIASIIVMDSNGNIIPFSYIPETNLGIALIDRSTGEKVDATVVKDDKIIKGKILSLDSDNVMLMTGGEISNIREYDRVTVGVTDDYTRPRLILNKVDNDFTLSYLLSSIAWNCIGTALIDETKNRMYLRLAGNIVNNTESDISANTILVSGDVYQYRSRQEVNTESSHYKSRNVFAQTVPAPMSSRRVETSMLEDYLKYDVGNRIVHNKDVAELGTWTFPVIKLYVHQTNEDDIVRFGYRFTAQGFIPSCSINVYSVNNENYLDGYLGSNEIEQSQKGNEIDIMLGESTMLQCKSEVIIMDVEADNNSIHKFNLPIDESKDNKMWHITTEDLKVEITNHNNKPAALVLKHYIGNKRLVDLRCQNFKKRDNGFIEWYFQIPPKSGTEPLKEYFTCQILTGSYY